ncbi:MAG: hypothetical protein CMF39_01505 [Legionellaceae bacterium]|nr:hypothetical protein [Legionellaceae bacterium]
MNIIDLLPQSPEMTLESPRMRDHMAQMLVMMLDEMSAATRAFFVQRSVDQFSAGGEAQALALCQELAEPYSAEEIDALLTRLDHASHVIKQGLADAQGDTAQFKRQKLIDFIRGFDINLDFPPVFISLMQLHFLSRFASTSNNAQLDISAIKRAWQVSSWVAKRLVYKFQTALSAFSTNFLSSFVTSSHDNSTLAGAE